MPQCRFLPLRMKKAGLLTVHTCSHIMAQAIQRLYPGTKLAIVSGHR